jgi:hypothetical protein
MFAEFPLGNNCDDPGESLNHVVTSGLTLVRTFGCRVEFSAAGWGGRRIWHVTHSRSCSRALTPEPDSHQMFFIRQESGDASVVYALYLYALRTYIFLFSSYFPPRTAHPTSHVLTGTTRRRLVLPLPVG